MVLTLEVSHISQHRHCTYTWQHDKCLCTTWCTVEPVDLWPRLMPNQERWSIGYASSWVGLGAERKQFIDDLNWQYICIGFLTIPALQIQVYCTVNTSIQKLIQINPELLIQLSKFPALKRPHSLFKKKGIFVSNWIYQNFWIYYLLKRTYIWIYI